MTSLSLFASATVPVHPSAAWYLADLGEFRGMHPLIALAVFNLDFLCIHPFRDGNGRVSRLHGLGIGHPFLAPRRCAGTWKLRAAESIGPVSGIHIPVAGEYFGKRGVPMVPESKARRGGS